MNVEEPLGAQERWREGTYRVLGEGKRALCLLFWAGKCLQHVLRSVTELRSNGTDPEWETCLR